MNQPPKLVTERELGSFRETQLAPAALLRLIEEHVRVLIRIAVGVGKSYAVDALLAYAQLYKRFDLVIYLAPTRAIVDERAIVAGNEPAPVRWIRFQRRPSELCGELDEAWKSLEVRRCSSFGRRSLCSECIATREEGRDCTWPSQFSGLKGTQLIFATEQYMLSLRSLPLLLRWMTHSPRVLVILDEARLLDASFELVLQRRDLVQFAEVLELLGGRGILDLDVATQWKESVHTLLRQTSHSIGDVHASFLPSMQRHAYRIQKEGIERFGEEFRYPAYDVAQFAGSKRDERWVKPDGSIHFIARPFLSCHALLLSAHHTSAYVGHRLGCEPIPSPFERYRFMHSGSRVFNLQSRVGATRHFSRNSKQILDTFAVALLRNIIDGRSSVIICRKIRRRTVAKFLRERLAGWGYDVQFLINPTGEPSSKPDARRIQVLHYGILGINDFSEYESAFCVDSYYVSDRVLNNAVQEFEPEHFRVDMEIGIEGNRLRRVQLARPAITDQDRVYLGHLHLRRLEVDPVLQVAGRVRFLTRPREVVMFQMHDLASEVEGCEEVRSLAELRARMELPTAAEIDAFLDGIRLRDCLADGRTVEEAAGAVGISRRTAFRRLKAAGSAKTPCSSSLRLFGTLAANLAGREGVR